MVSVHIDHDTAMGALTFTDGTPWSVTVTEHKTAAGGSAYRVTQSDGTFTTHTSRLSALLVMLELIAFTIELEYPDR